jgi:hypothetical protein
MGGNVPDVVAEEICLYTLLLIPLLIRIMLISLVLYLDPVVDNSSIRHREHTGDHAKSIVYWDGMSKYDAFVKIASR